MPFLDRISGGLLQARAQQAYASRNAAELGRGAISVRHQDSIRQVTGGSGVAPTAPVCGANACNSGWLKGLRNRRRPYFEQDWACSTRCLSTLVRAAVRREAGDLTSDEALPPHRHRVPLGLVLLAQGWIDHAQLQTALEAQRRSGRGRIGDWLIDGGVSADRVTRGLGVQWNCPVLSLEGFSPSAMALVLPQAIAEHSGLLPVRTAGRSLLYLGFESQMNAAAALAIERMSGLSVESGLLSESDFACAREAIKASAAVAVHQTRVPHQDALCDGIVRAIDQAQPLASRMVRIGHMYWLRLWLESGARGGIGDLPPDAQDVEDHLFSIGSTGTRVH